MTITDKDVRHVARLARLSLTDDEVVRLVKDLSQFLDYVTQLSELDGDLPDDAGPAATAPVREDRVVAGLDHEAALGQAPRHSDGAFAVPTFVEEA
jgi:aspartyl-tRNA(Asn)/glutamyl-tRNA(Gln) amidotransferase subunit C